MRLVFRRYHLVAMVALLACMFLWLQSYEYGCTVTCNVARSRLSINSSKGAVAWVAKPSDAPAALPRFVRHDDQLPMSTFRQSQTAAWLSVRRVLGFSAGVRTEPDSTKLRGSYYRPEVEERWLVTPYWFLCIATCLLTNALSIVLGKLAARRKRTATLSKAGVDAGRFPIVVLEQRAE
jgi:hypothetical protein